jgi:putative inorganic carbon (hco3(-)) transporter
MSDFYPSFDYEPVAGPRRGAASGAGAEDSRAGGRPEAARVDGGAEVETADAAAGTSGVSRPRGRERAGLRRAHALSYAGLFLFTAVLYFRPYEYLPLPQTLAFWIAILTLAAFFPAQVAAEGTLTARPREVNLVLLLAIGGLLSIPLAINPGEAWETFTDPFMKVVLMFLVVVNVVRTRRRLYGLLWLALAIGCYLSYHAVQDYRAGKFEVEGYRVGGAIGGMFGNPNDMALYLVTVMPLAIGMLLVTRNPLAKLAYGACAALAVCGSVVTYSRGGFLGLACALTVLGWKLGRRNRAVTTAGVALAMVALLLLAPGNYTERLASILDSGKDLVGSSSMRQQLFWLSLNVALKNPVFGVGMGNFHTVSIREQVTHNAYTEVAAEMGLASAVVYVLFILAALKSLRLVERATYDDRRRDRDFYLAVGVQAALAGYMVSSFFASVAYQWYLYYLVGYAVALRRMYEARPAAGAGEGARPAAGAGLGERAALGRS